MNHDSDPQSPKAVTGQLIVAIVGTTAGGLILSAVQGTFVASSALLTLLIVVVLVVFSAYAFPISRQLYVAIGRPIVALVQKVEKAIAAIASLVIDNWKLLAGGLLLLAVASAVFMLSQIVLSVVLIFSLTAAILLIWNWLLNRSQIQAAQQELTIRYASYGANGKSSNVTRVLKSCVSDGKLELRVNNDNLGCDPILGVVKSLTVVYTCFGQTVSKTIPEGEVLTLP